CALLGRLGTRAASLSGPVVFDHRLDRAVGLLGDPHRDAARRPAPSRLGQCLADHLVERDLRALGELLAEVDVEVDANLLRDAEPLGEASYRRSETLVAEDDRLEVERQVA